jgi:Xaa-Pro aminopeptidase
MKNTRKHKLIEIEWPEFGACDPPAPIGLEEFESRIEAARAAMDRMGLTHLVVYGDREHFANLAYLTGFDPRFEEALLVAGSQGTPLLLVGNECEGYLPVSPLYEAGKLRSELYQPFSLLNQPRDRSRLIGAIFADDEIGNGSKVGCVGWKYFSDAEHPDGAHAMEIPAYLVDTLRELAGRENVVNATGLFMNPRDGLRANCSPAEIAYFEYANVLASEGLKKMIFGLREGMTERDLAKLSEYGGEPLGCHMTIASGDGLGLSSPSSAIIQRGAPLSANVCYWGGNICRAGWVAASADELPSDAQDYAENFAGPYFEVLSEWFEMLRIGTPGAKLSDLVEIKLPFEKFGIFLNAGHLIHLDEWVSSPIYPGSEIPVRSGMVFQVDVIPSSPVYFSTRMEDGLVVADKELRKQIREQYPDCFARCQKRRDFMIDVLGIRLPEEILPLSNIPAIVPPFFLDPNTIFAME